MFCIAFNCGNVVISFNISQSIGFRGMSSIKPVIDTRNCFLVSFYVYIYVCIYVVCMSVYVFNAFIPYIFNKHLFIFLV